MNCSWDMQLSISSCVYVSVDPFFSKMHRMLLCLLLCALWQYLRAACKEISHWKTNGWSLNNWGWEIPIGDALSKMEWSFVFPALCVIFCSAFLCTLLSSFMVRLPVFFICFAFYKAHWITSMSYINKLTSPFLEVASSKHNAAAFIFFAKNLS